MVCICNPNFHFATALSTTGVLTVTNSTNIGNFEPFLLRLRVSPNTVITGAPVSYGININGTDVPLRSIWGLPIPTDRLTWRRTYEGRYIVPASGTPYVVLVNVPTCASDASLTPFTAPAAAAAVTPEAAVMPTMVTPTVTVPVSNPTVGTETVDSTKTTTKPARA